MAFKFKKGCSVVQEFILIGNRWGSLAPDEAKKLMKKYPNDLKMVENGTPWIEVDFWDFSDSHIKKGKWGVTVKDLVGLEVFFSIISPGFRKTRTRGVYLQHPALQGINPIHLCLQWGIINGAMEYLENLIDVLIFDYAEGMRGYRSILSGHELVSRTPFVSMLTGNVCEGNLGLLPKLYGFYSETERGIGVVGVVGVTIATQRGHRTMQIQGAGCMRVEIIATHGLGGFHEDSRYFKVSMFLYDSRWDWHRGTIGQEWNGCGWHWGQDLKGLVHIFRKYRDNEVLSHKILLFVSSAAAIFVLGSSDEGLVINFIF
ncbi:hypothetical protein EDD85DRAFT_787512 [Armillaria nabsnona]|nr:hypothetical protein EDD85DRAFT_787512 [Armillaria nabsnona]